MKKSVQILKGESGMAFLILVLIIAVILTTLGFLASTSTSVTATQRGGVREKLAAEIVLENISIMAKQAYELSQFQGANPCPTGTHESFIAGAGSVRLCVSGSVETSCVQDPRLDGNSSPSSMICSPQLSGGLQFDKKIKISGTVAFNGMGSKDLAQSGSHRRNPNRDLPFENGQFRFDTAFRKSLAIVPLAEALQRTDLPSPTAITTTGNLVNPIVLGNDDYIQCLAFPVARANLICGTVSVCMANPCDPKKRQTYVEVIGFSSQ